MTSVERTMSTNEFWKKLSYNPSIYFDEFSLNLVNEVLDEDADRFNTITQLIKEEETEEESSVPFETDQPPLEASSSNSPPTESQPLLKLVCGVCGAPAHGYNFDQITCESCKAFFRRNALRNMTYLRCRFSGSCTINIHTRRQCTYCRLKKCFDINMRKDWIRTDEERELRKIRNIQKQQRKLNKASCNEPIVDLPIVVRKKKRIQQVIAKTVTQEVAVRKAETISRIHRFGIHRNLLEADKILLNNIQNAYTYGANQANFNHMSSYTPNASLAQFLNDESVNHQSLIFFYKHVSEFRQFPLADQILLIKCNMVDLIHLHHIITQNFHEHPKMGENMSKWVGPNFHEQMSSTRSRFDCFMKYPLVLKISLIVFVFSINLSTPRGSSQFTDYVNKKKLYENQNYYLELLWRYLVYLFGEKEATRSMGTIVMQILRYQTLMNTMDEALRRNNAYQDIMNPLMQSIFGLT